MNGYPMKKIGELSETDKALMARVDIERKAIEDFVTRHISAQYSLGQGTEVTAAGDIMTIDMEQINGNGASEQAQTGSTEQPTRPDLRVEPGGKDVESATGSGS